MFHAGHDGCKKGARFGIQRVSACGWRQPITIDDTGDTYVCPDGGAANLESTFQHGYWAVLKSQPSTNPNRFAADGEFSDLRLDKMPGRLKEAAFKFDIAMCPRCLGCGDRSQIPLAFTWELERAARDEFSMEEHMLFRELHEVLQEC